MDSAKAATKLLGKKDNAKALAQIESIQAEDFIPLDQRGEAFDPGKAEKDAKTCAVSKDYAPKNETTDFLRSQIVQNNETNFSDDEYFLTRSEIASQNPQINNLEVEEALEYSIETCKQTDAPYPLSLTRDLHVEVSYVPEESKEVKVCSQHDYKKRVYYKKDALKECERLRHSLSRDPSIQWYHVEDPKDGGVLHRYMVEAKWEHKEDATACNIYQTQHRIITPAHYEEIGDTWHYEDDSLRALGHSPDCTYVKTDCLDTTPTKNIHGKEVHRQCWKEKLTFICQLSNSIDCPYLKNQNCDLIKKECLKVGEYGCELWELTFKCYSKFIKRQLGTGDLYGLDEEINYEPNDSFSEIAAKLAVFEAIKKDLETSEASNAQTVQVFQGKRMQCSKSVADDLLYDCCFS